MVATYTIARTIFQEFSTTVFLFCWFYLSAAVLYITLCCWALFPFLLSSLLLQPLFLLFFSPSTPAFSSPLPILSFNLSLLALLPSPYLPHCTFVKHALCLTKPSNSSAFKGVICDVVPKCGGVGTWTTPNCHGNPCHTLSVTHHAQPQGTWGKETVGRLQWEAHSVVCACMHTYSHLNPFYQNLIILHIHIGMQSHTHTVGHPYTVLTSQPSCLCSNYKGAVPCSCLYDIDRYILTWKVFQKKKILGVGIQL